MAQMKAKGTSYRNIYNNIGMYEALQPLYLNPGNSNMIGSTVITPE
jgi:hypothetical protein